MQNINTLEEQINYYKKEIQNLKEHYGEFEFETNQEIKELQERIDKAIEYIKDNCYDYDFETYSSLTTDEVIKLLDILKGEKNND